MNDTTHTPRIHDAGTIPILTRHDDWAELRLNRPDVHNRLEPIDLETLRAHIATLNDDRSVRVVVLTGTGSRTFSSGYHLGALGKSGPGTDSVFDDVVQAIETLRAVTIARLNGSVYGGATDLALACDFRIGAHGAQMSMPAARLGLHFYGRGLRRWVSRIGVNAAKQAFLTAHTFSSDELAACGFFTHTVDPSQLDTTCRALVDQLRILAPLALQGMKRIINDTAVGEYDDQVARRQYLDCLRSEDFAEGVAATAVKRTPVFKGR